MRKFFVFSMMLFFNTHLISYSQNWPKIFTGRYAYWLTEHYDMGCFIIGPLNNFNFSYIVKNNINGDKIWEKRLGNGQYLCIAGCIEPTIDGGFVISGQTNKYDSWGDPFIMRFNACGEVQWCTVISIPGTDDYAISVKPTPFNEYVVLTIYSDPSPWHHTQLYKFNSGGTLIWRQDYPVQGNAFEDEPRNLRVDSSAYLISGMCYYPDPGVPGGYERPYYICTDTAGNVNWRLVYGAVNGFHGTPFYSTIRNSSKSFYYSTGVHSNFCDTPVLIKFSINGTEDYHEDLFPGSCPAGNSAINFLNDTTIITMVGGTLSGVDIYKWIKTDTLGIEFQSKEYTQNWMKYTGLSIISSDQKIVNISRSLGGPTFYFYKLNSDLEFDSIYTMPHTYDSLCPYPIVSDTVDPDCGLIVSIEDSEENPEAYCLKVYPNPAANMVTVEIPELLQKQTGPAGFQATTVYHQWGSATLEVYGLFGKKQLEYIVQQGQPPVEIDVSQWERGMYVFRLVFRGETVAAEKVVVE